MGRVGKNFIPFARALSGPIGEQDDPQVVTRLHAEFCEPGRERLPVEVNEVRRHVLALPIGEQRRCRVEDPSGTVAYIRVVDVNPRPALSSGRARRGRHVAGGSCRALYASDIPDLESASSAVRDMPAIDTPHEPVV